MTIDRLYNSQRHMIICIIHIIRQYMYIVYTYMCFIWALETGRKKRISDLILYFPTMYIYCVYTATSCIPKIGKITHKKAKTCFMFIQVKDISWLYASSIQIKHRFIYLYIDCSIKCTHIQVTILSGFILLVIYRPCWCFKMV